MEAILFFSALVLAGAIVYSTNSDGGALLIALGITGAAVAWLKRATRRWFERREV